jgi:hypothetical protein|uniref:Uncharacterized protein n=1 Tax=Phage sp. ctHEp8 TaxID=2825790 RepID=A0A8S5TY67_9VIRU|nr:MAG TPA: hypothetical protein [Phage sp. ctHEp8]DAQ17159.1 MAG TPA: hypothetical protein [Caudoviricetes sp.]
MADNTSGNLVETIKAIGEDIRLLSTTIVGAGRPDKPDTTNGKIKGTEPNGSVYDSIDGAGVGAWQWQKRDGVWVVTIGDTGLITLKTQNLKAGAYVKLQRINNIVFCLMGGLNWGLFGYKGKKEGGFIPRQAGRIDIVSQGYIPVGFRAVSSLSYSLYDDDTGRSAANLYIGGLQDSNFMRITPFHENPKIRGNDAIPDIGASNLRTPAIIWVTNDKWID